MKKQLTAEHAVITTTSIEVKVLTIERRQVTLAVFRQLPEAPLVDRTTFQLNGTPWGHVNYHWGVKKGLHVVWQKGNVLHRDLLQKLAEIDRDIQWFEAKQLYDGYPIADSRYSNKERRQYVHDWNAAIAPLFALDQLFIAV